MPSTLQVGAAPALGQDGPLQSYMADNAAAAARAAASASRPSMVSSSPDQLSRRPLLTAALISSQLPAHIKPSHDTVSGPVCMHQPKLKHHASDASRKIESRSLFGSADSPVRPCWACSMGKMRARQQGSQALLQGMMRPSGCQRPHPQQRMRHKPTMCCWPKRAALAPQQPLLQPR